MRKLLLTTAAVLTASLAMADVQQHATAKELIQKQKAERIQIEAEHAKKRADMQETILKSQADSKMSQKAFQAEIRAMENSQKGINQTSSNKFLQNPINGNRTVKGYYGGDYDKELNQEDMPYQAFGDDNALIGAQLYVGSSMDNLKHLGDSEFTYDDKGNLVKSVSIYQESIYTVKEIEVYGTNGYTEIYYLTKPGEWVLVSKSSRNGNYYGFELDGFSADFINGQLVINSQFITEFDAQKRPVKTEYWERNYDWSTGKYEFKATRRWDWSYPTNTVQVIISSLNDTVWGCNEKEEFTVDSEGLLINSSYRYNPTTQEFIGSTKEGHFTSPDGLTEISKTWYWNRKENDWEFDCKYVNIYTDDSHKEYTSKMYQLDDDTQQLYLSQEIYVNNGELSYEIKEIDYDNEGEIKHGNHSKEVRDQYGRGIAYESYYYGMSKDSTYKWIGESKAEYEYADMPDKDFDGADYYSKVLKYRWDRTVNEWIYSSKEEYEYDQWHNTTLYIESRWDKEASEWEEYTKQISRFEMFNKDFPFQTYSESYSVDWYGDYVGKEKSEWNYDQNGNQVLYIDYAWDKTTGSWYGTIKESCKYKDDIVSRQNWSGYIDESGQTIWTPSSELEQVYDSNGNLISYTYLAEWGEYINAWLWGEKETYLYDALGNLNEHSKFYFDSMDQDWDISEKEVDLYKDGILQCTEKYRSTAVENDSTDQQTYVLTLFQKTEYNYNDQGYCIGNVKYELSYFWNDSISELVEELIPVEKTDVTWDGLMMTELINYSYDLYDGWYPTTRETYEKDSIYTVKTTYGYDRWAAESAWTAFSKNKFLNDEEGRTIYEECLYWDNYLQDWAGERKVEYAYNAAGEEIMFANYYWSDGWYGYSKSEQEHDQYGNEIHRAYFKWDDTDKEWFCTSLSDRQFDADGNCLLDIYLSDSFSKGWGYGYQNEYRYDSFGQLTYNASYRWDRFNQVWYGEYCNEYIYNELGDEIGYASYQWDYDSLCWVGSRKSTYNYEEFSWGFKTTDEYYSWRNNEWVLRSAETEEVHFRADGNIDYIIEIDQNYDTYDGSCATTITKTVAVYASVTGVESTATSTAQISVVDGAIMVKASDDAQIIVNTMAGTQVATATGSATIAVPAGIYLVTVDGVTTKLMVR